jgi:AraC-like DNA-binding protein
VFAPLPGADCLDRYLIVALWTRLVDYAERIDGEVCRREPAPAGVPLILAWSGTVTVPGAGGFAGGFVAGPTDRWTDTVCRGDAAGVQVDLTWTAARAVLGRPLAELRHATVAVEDVWGAAGRRLVEQLAEESTPAGRRRLVEAFLRRRAETSVPAVVTGAATILDRRAGRISVAGLAAELGCGRQYLHRQVSRHLGLAPHTLARLVRFRSALTGLRAGRHSPGWAGLAADYGYYDQSHLYRDFRELAGMTPGQAETAWRQAPVEATSVHDGASGGAVASWP